MASRVPGPSRTPEMVAVDQFSGVLLEDLQERLIKNMAQSHGFGLRFS